MASSRGREAGTYTGLASDSVDFFLTSLVAEHSGRGANATTIVATELRVGADGLRAVILSDGSSNPAFSKYGEQFAAWVGVRHWGQPEHVERVSDDPEGPGDVRQTEAGFDIALREAEEFSISFGHSDVLVALLRQHDSELQIKGL